MGGVPGFLAGVPGFLGLFLVFLGVPGFSGVPECFVMFRCSGVPCSGVPGSTTCHLQRSLTTSGPLNLFLVNKRRKHGQEHKRPATISNY